MLAPGRAVAWDLSDPDPALSGASGATAAAPFHARSFVLNPALMGYAGLGRRGLRLSVGTAVDARVAASRRLGDDKEDTAESPLRPRVLPHAAAVGSVGLLHLTAGAWYEQKSGGRVDFPCRDPNDPLLPSAWDRHRYGAMAYRLRRHHFGLALAWRPRPWLAFGAAVGAQWLALEHRRALATGTAGNEERPQADLVARLSLRAPFVPLGILGAVARPWRWLRLGLSFELSGVARLDGTALLEPARPDSWTRALIGEATASLRLRLPWVLRAGVGVDLGRVSVDVAGSVTDSPRPRHLVANTPGLLVQPATWLVDVVPVPTLPLGITLRRRFALSTTLRVAILRDSLYLSAGYGFSQGETDPRYRSAALISPDRHLLALGLTFCHGGLRLDVGYAHVEAVSTNATGQARQTHLVDPTAAVSIAAGRQSLSGDLGSVTLTIDMDLSP